MDDRYDPVLRGHVERAFSRLRHRLRAHAPTLARHTAEWMRSLTGDAPPQTYFTHPQAFPMLLLPWWFEGGLDGAPDRAFQGDVVYSTINGYYFVRLIDDLMDRERPPTAAVLPALIFFHTEFQGSYQRHFPHGHPFWAAFSDGSMASAESASVDAGLPEIDRDRFLRVSARKVAGAKVPLAAVGHRYGRSDLLGPWSAFVDLLGCWHQMANDMRGWNRDLDHGRRTYFLSAAPSRADGPAAIAEWVLTEGLGWGMAELDGWMAQLLVAARGLDCPPLVAYLEQRQVAMAGEWHELLSSLTVLRRLAASLR